MDKAVIILFIENDIGNSKIGLTNILEYFSMIGVQNRTLSFWLQNDSTDSLAHMLVVRFMPSILQLMAAIDQPVTNTLYERSVLELE